MRKKIEVVKVEQGGSGRDDKKDNTRCATEAERKVGRGPDKRRNNGKIQSHIIASQGTNKREVNT